MKWKKVLSLCLAAVTVVSAALLTGCGGGGASSDTSFTMWIYQGENAQYYTDYADNPVLQWMTAQKWGEEEKQVEFEFWIPAAGTALDSYSTMIGSGSYPDVLDCTVANPIALYEEGTIIDLTEYIEQYMPNYTAFLDAHPELKPYATYEVDGEQKNLTVIGLKDDYESIYCGYCYRRDWIVKYGTNPETGEKFTGGYTDESDPDSWEDDVVFPSGGTDPVYISDWEWMFEIFEKAYTDLGIDDAYCISMYYTGFTWPGDLCSSFGGGNFNFYEDSEGKVQLGCDKDHARAYLKCLNTWYEKGWLDESFNERTSDMHYAIDDTAVRQGKVGMWMGLKSTLGGRLDGGDEYTDGIFVSGCALPINDVYGDESCQNVEPDCVMTKSELKGQGYAVTSAAKDKDIATLLTFIDYLYSDEGAVLATFGLSPEQMEEIGTSFYEDNGIPNGTYEVNEEGKNEMVETIRQDSGGLKNAAVLSRFPCLKKVSILDEGYADSYQHSLDLWIQYKGGADVWATPAVSNLPEKDSKAADVAFNQRVRPGKPELAGEREYSGVLDYFPADGYLEGCRLGLHHVRGGHFHGERRFARGGGHRRREPLAEAVQDYLAMHHADRHDDVRDGRGAKLFHGI